MMGTTAPLKQTSLTRDEKEAAEAAFKGAPFKAKWSKRARTIYDGIVAAMVRRTHGQYFDSPTDRPPV